MSDYSKKRAYEETDNSQLYDDPNDLVNAVISALAVPESKTVVAETYANDKNQATEIQAYAKIAGNNWTFYVKTLSISIGRNTDNAPKDSEVNVDIDLGPAKVVSRQHANINYNLSSRLWELYVLGRNGAKVDGSKVPCGPNSTPTPLYSGAVVDIGGTQMMFILPDARPEISRAVLNFIGPKLPKPKSKRNQNYPTTSSSNSEYFWGDNKDGAPTTMNNNLKAFQLFNTDEAQHNSQASSNGSTGGSNSNNMISSTSTMDSDLSKDESRDIKPPYSYATMITQAILSNTEGVLSLSEIYDWIAKRYAFYRFSKSGWQNSIRHNLSLNKAFEKVPRRASEPGKGMKWQISDSYKHEFLKKFQSGSLSKVRRGSSVSRQLQLHLAIHNDLPSQEQQHQQRQNNIPNPLNYQPPQTTGNPQLQQHRLQTSQDLQFMAATGHSYVPQGYPQPSSYNPNAYVPTQLPPLQAQAGQHIQTQLPLPQPTPSQQYHHSRVSSVGSNSSFPTSNFPSQPPFPSHVQKLPYPPHSAQSQGSLPLLTSQPQQQDLKPLSSDLRPITQGSGISVDRTEVKHSSSGQEISESNTQLSSPIKSKAIGTTTPPKQYQPLYYNNKNDIKTNINTSKDGLNSTTDPKIESNNSNMEFGMITSPTKPFSISAVEAYTPERGARKKSQDNGNANGNSTSNGNGSSNQQGQQNNLQSSPALWSFVQFSTPAQPGQTREVPQSQEKQEITPTKGAFLPDSPLNLKTKDKDLGDLRNIDLAKGFKK